MKNEPAFPVKRINCNGHIAKQFEGMTLRDYFAAKAMQAIEARGEMNFIEDVAVRAYCIADKMLEKREL